MDCADGARLRGHTAFFTSPEHFRAAYQPLNAPWSLLRNYISDADFFAQSWASARFYNSGCRILEPNLSLAVVQLPAPMEGLPLPAPSMLLAIGPGYTYAAAAPDHPCRTPAIPCTSGLLRPVVVQGEA